MKRLTALILGAALILTNAIQADAVVIGPPDSGLAPEYCPPQITVVDTLASTLNGKHRRKWIAGRNAALAEWGLPFAAERGVLPVPWTDENVNSGLAAEGDAVQCAIVLIRNRTSQPGDQGGIIVPPAGGAAILYPWSGWWQDRIGISQVVAHEVGHALGFAHGTTGVMSGAFHVSREERRVAAAYYESLGFMLWRTPERKNG